MNGYRKGKMTGITGLLLSLVLLLLLMGCSRKEEVQKSFTKADTGRESTESTAESEMVTIQEMAEIAEQEVSLDNTAAEGTREQESEDTEIEDPEEEGFAFSLASQILLENLEINGDAALGAMDYLEEGAEEFYGEICILIAIGTNRADQFVREGHYAVSPTGAVYEYDPLSDQWSPYNTDANLRVNRPDHSLFIVLSEPYGPEFYSYYAAEPEEDHVLIIPLQENMIFRIQKLSFDEALEELVVVEEVKAFPSEEVGEVFYEKVPMTETIPMYRIVGEQGEQGIVGEWDAVYDGESENGVHYVPSFASSVG